MGYRETGAVIRPEEVHFERLPPLVGIALFDGYKIEANAGIDDEDIDPARALARRVERAADGARIGHVTGDREGATAFLLDRSRNSRDFGRRSRRATDDGARPRVAARDSLPDAPPGSGYERNPARQYAVQIHHRFPITGL